MIKVTITGMTIEIPESVGLTQALIGAVAGTAVSGAKHAVEVNVPEPAKEVGPAPAELERQAEEAAKAQARSDAAKKAADTKRLKSEAEAKAKTEEEAKAKAEEEARRAALEDDDEAPAGAYTKDDVKAAVVEATQNGHDIIAILAKFDAVKISGIDPKRYPEVMEYLKGLK